MIITTKCGTYEGIMIFNGASYIELAMPNGSTIAFPRMLIVSVTDDIEPETKNLIGTKNAGFTIIEQGKTAVIGLRESDGMCVAWDYYFDRNGDAGFTWGRYGSKDYAQECFRLKEAGQYSGN